MSEHNFLVGPGQNQLSDQADKMGFIIEGSSEHQAMIDRVTSLYQHGVLMQDEAEAVYNRIIQKMLPDMKLKSMLIVPDQSLVN